MTPPRSPPLQPLIGEQDAANPAASDSHPRSQLDSTTLFRGGRSVEIRHNGEVYRLQATRLGKLILTK